MQMTIVMSILRTEQAFRPAEITIYISLSTNEYYVFVIAASKYKAYLRINLY